jgi:GTP 3',8-cyclase
VYEIADGRILTWSLETHLTDHCNLRCAQCCTLSPHLAPRSVPLDALERDLSRAAAVLRPNVLKLTGGEPLLHPEVVRCVEIARGSGVAEQLSMTTNGFLAPAAPEALYRLLDRMTVSWYASAPLPIAVLDGIRGRCARHGVALTVKPVSRFARMNLETDPADGPAAELRARAVHAACWLKVRCHLVHRGRFYACTRPPHLDAVLRRRGIASRLSGDDGVGLLDDDGPGPLLGRLAAYLEGEEPLASCRHCLGASGPWEPHRQLARAEA